MCKETSSIIKRMEKSYGSRRKKLIVVDDDGKEEIIHYL